MWCESSSVSIINLKKKIYYSSRDIEFFLGGYFFGAPCTIDMLLTICNKFQWTHESLQSRQIGNCKISKSVQMMRYAHVIRLLKC